MPFTISDGDPVASQGDLVAPKSSKFTISDDVPAPKKIDTSEPPTWLENQIAKFAPSSAVLPNVRGSAIGRLAMGAADPGTAIVQLAANAIGQGEAVNKGIQEREQEYQQARTDAGSTGFDPARLVGNVGISLLAPTGAAATGLGAVGKGILQGGAFAAAEPVNNGAENFWKDKAKQVATGAAVGGFAAPVAGAIARVISPNASINRELQLLREEGVKPTAAQALGGWANKLEEKAQSLPLAGDFIANARQRAADEFQQAAVNRAAEPIGATVSTSGRDAVNDLQGALSQSYDKVIPKLATDITDPNFVSKLANIRQMVQALPQREADTFDSVLSREIDGRVAPNGVLSGQNLKDAWNALRDAGQQFSKSPDAYQQNLGQAFKQTFQELKDQVVRTNPADVVNDLKNTDFAYANFKRIQRAAAALGAEGGEFTPAQLQNAVKALDRSKDKGAFARGDALMQDLSEAGKNILSPKYPDSGTAGRVMALTPTGLGVGAAAAIPAAVGYTQPMQNLLAAIVSKRPEAAPQIANALRRIMPAITAGSTYGVLQR